MIQLIRRSHGAIVKSNNDGNKPMALGDRGNVGTAPASALKNPETTSKNTKQDRQNAAGIQKMVGYDHVNCDYES